MTRNSEHRESLSLASRLNMRFAQLDIHIARMAKELRESESADGGSEPSQGGVVELPSERFTDAELERF